MDKKFHVDSESIGIASKIIPEKITTAIISMTIYYFAHRLLLYNSFVEFIRKNIRTMFGQIDLPERALYLNSSRDFPHATNSVFTNV